MGILLRNLKERQAKIYSSMIWEKKGHIYTTDGISNWSKTHASQPIVDVLSDRLRIYYASRDETGKSRTSFLEVDKSNLKNIKYIHHKPILDLGKKGAFDDSGIMPTCLINHNNLKYLYYIGWTTRNTVPFHNSIGLAVSEDGIHFTRMFDGPIITTNHLEPYFTGTAFVLKDQQVWRMYYLSCTKWELINDKMEPFYNIKYAESHDGIVWKRQGDVAIDFKDSKEGGIASASVLKIGDRYIMWFAFRQATDYRTHREASYKIGFAESLNGKDWIRCDEKAGISLSNEG